MELLNAILPQLTEILVTLVIALAGYLGTSAQQALDFISDYLLGNDWYIVGSLCNFQANTYIVDAIMVKYPDVKYTHKLRRICKSVCDIVRSKD